MKQKADERRQREEELRRQMEDIAEFEKKEEQTRLPALSSKMLKVRAGTAGNGSLRTASPKLSNMSSVFEPLPEPVPVTVELGTNAVEEFHENREIVKACDEESGREQDRTRGHDRRQPVGGRKRSGHDVTEL